MRASPLRISPKRRFSDSGSEAESTEVLFCSHTPGETVPRVPDLTWNSKEGLANPQDPASEPRALGDTQGLLVSEACGSSSEENVPSPPPHPTAVWAWTGSDRLFSPRSPHHRCQQPRVKEAWPVWLLLSAPWWEAGPQLLTTCPRRLLTALSPSPGRLSR